MSTSSNSSLEDQKMFTKLSQMSNLNEFIENIDVITATTILEDTLGSKMVRMDTYTDVPMDSYGTETYNTLI